MQGGELRQKLTDNMKDGNSWIKLFKSFSKSFQGIQSFFNVETINQIPGQMRTDGLINLTMSV